MPAEGGARLERTTSPPGRRGTREPRLAGFARDALPFVLPVLAFAVQYPLWGLVQPFAWFLFFPAVFAAAWVGGLRGGLIATAIAAPLAWFWFMPPAGSIAKDSRLLVSVAMFVCMGVSFGLVFGRLASTERSARNAHEALAARASELAALNARLSELDTLKSQLFANVSHELRTPLAMILASAERVLANDGLTEEQRVGLATIERNAANLQEEGPGGGRVVAVVEDIGERKRVEAELRHLAALRERVATEAAGLGVWDLDLRDWALTWSDTTFRMLGYAPTPDGRATPEMWTDRILPTDLPDLLDAIARARDDRRLFASEHRIVGLGGERWVRSFGRFLYDDATGAPLRFVGMAFVDTSRHAAEVARQEVEERLGLLIDKVKEYALFTLDPDGRVTSWNQGARRIYGYTAAEAVGLHRSVFYPPEERARVASHLRTAAETGSVEVEGWRVRKNGDRFWGDLVLTARKDARGDVVGYLAVTRDLTERRAAEERFRLALEAAPSAMLMVDGKGTIALLNREAEQLFGYPRDELVGRPVEVLLPVHLREAHVALRRAFAGAPEPRRMGVGRDLWCVRKDGTAVPIEVGLTPVRGQQQDFVVAAAVDITERKRADQQIREAQARLQDRIADLEAFSYTVSHDLRAPLRAIQGYSNFLMEDLGERADPETRRMLSALDDAAVRMDHLIRDVLGYSQISGELPVTVPVDLDGVVAHVVRHYPEVAAADVHVREPLGRVRGQESLLVQIFANLLGNAVKFVTRHVAPRVEVWSERREGGRLRVFVEDNGPGIPNEHWERIFRPFERLRLEDGAPGSGIGLAIVKKATERLGGEVGVESEPGTGSRFWFELAEVRDAP